MVSMEPEIQAWFGIEPRRPRRGGKSCGEKRTGLRSHGTETLGNMLKLKKPVCHLPFHMCKDVTGFSKRPKLRNCKPDPPGKR